MNDLKEEFKSFINKKLPSHYSSPVKFNHCFNRIILDWLFKGCWYNYLNKNKTALYQLSSELLQTMIVRMNEWLTDKEALIYDNKKSLEYRKKLK